VILYKYTPLTAVGSWLLVAAIRKIWAIIAWRGVISRSAGHTGQQRDDPSAIYIVFAGRKQMIMIYSSHYLSYKACDILD
jgi:hypothetical protein